MKIASLLCVAMLSSSPHLAAIEQSNNFEPKTNQLQLSQYLWDEEWSSPEEHEVKPVEASLMDLAPAPVDANQMVVNSGVDAETFKVPDTAVFHWDWMQSGREGGGMGLELTQYLWDEEWSSPEEHEVKPVEASLMDLAPVDANQMVANSGMDAETFKVPDTAVFHWDWMQSGREDGGMRLELTQYLWDEEWSSPTLIDSLPASDAQVDEIQLEENTEVIAGYFWNMITPEADLSSANINLTS